MTQFSQQQIDDLKKYISNIKLNFWGKICYRYIPFRKDVVLSNLYQVFHDVLSHEEIEKLAQGFYTHLTKSIAENVKLRFMSAKTVRSMALLQGHEILINNANNPDCHGALLLTGHFGNWEFSPIAGMMNFEEHQGRIYFIRKVQRIKFLGDLLFKRFYNAGLRVLPQQNALRDVFGLLKDNNTVVFILDQKAKGGSRLGIDVELFGRKAGTHRSLALIAQSSGAPVIPVCTFRNEEGKHVLQFAEPLKWIEHEDSKQEIFLNTKAYNEALEKMILAHPDQWLWLYKRWVPVLPYQEYIKQNG